MRCRVLVALALGGCSFTTPGGATRDAGDDIDAGDAGHDAPPADASPCRAVEVSAMSAHTCARMENGDVWCWGINGKGEVGRPSQTLCSATSCNPVPEKLALPPATKLAVAEEYACAITGAQVYCWGRDAENQFGDGLAANTATPVLVAERAGASSLVGGLTYGCSLHGDAVKCAGNNARGELGDPTMAAHAMPFTAVPSGTDVIAGGYQHVCTIQGGFVYCWGANFAGQVDTHFGVDAYGPRIVTGVATAKAIANGYGHTCAALTAADVRCWGANGNGQLGVGDSLPRFDQVVTSKVLGIVELSAGSDHTCGRTAAGSVYCWGERYGSTPVQIGLAHPAVSIASGSYHDCFALDDGTVQCLGFNGYGQLGTGQVSGTIANTVSQVALCQ